MFQFFFSIDSDYWSREVDIPKYKDISYRYLICTVDPMSDNLHVRRWETHLIPRTISAYHDETETVAQSANTSENTAVKKSDIDTFGDINGVEKIDRGWLTTETIIQFKFIRNPFIIKQKLKNRLLYVKVRQPNKININIHLFAEVEGWMGGDKLIKTMPFE